MRDHRLLSAIPEREFQDQVTALAAKAGWLVYHTYDSRRSQAGFPDLVMLRDGRCVVAELKSERGRLTDDQVRWVAAWDATDAEVFVWRPSDWDAVVDTLTSRRRRRPSVHAELEAARREIQSLLEELDVLRNSPPPVGDVEGVAV